MNTSDTGFSVNLLPLIMRSFVLAAAASLALPIFAQKDGPVPATLLPNQKAEREITVGETHRYRAAVKKGEFFQVKSEQTGVNVALKLLDQAGRVAAAMESMDPDQSIETLSFIAPVTGVYELQVFAQDDGAAAGSYILTSSTRPAEERDKERINVERSFNALYGIQDVGVILEGLVKILRQWSALNDDYMVQSTLGLIIRAKTAIAVQLVNQGDQIAKAGTATAWRKALLKFNEALEQFQQLDDDEKQGICLNRIGGMHYQLKEYPKALESLQRSSDLLKETDQTSLKAYNFFSIGGVYSRLGDYLNARKFAELAIPLLKETGDKEEEAETLLDLGLYNSTLGDKEKAIESYLLAAPILDELGDKRREADALIKAGGLYWLLRESRKALECYSRAMDLAKNIKDKDLEANCLNYLGETYNTLLSDYPKALRYFNLALQIRRTVIDRRQEGGILNNIGTIYLFRDDRKALVFFNRALSVLQKLKDSELIVTVLINIGQINLHRKDYAKALANLSLGLIKANKVKDRIDAYTAALLHSIGKVYLARNENDKALDYLTRAFYQSKIAGDKLGEAEISSNMAMAYAQKDHQRMAVFFTKLYVNKLQERRVAAQGLDSQIQKLLLRDKADFYKLLANFMIADEQYDLALQVLDLYQDEQFFDFDPGADSLTKQVDYTPREQKHVDNFDRYGKNIIEINSQIDAVKLRKEKGSLTKAEVSQLEKLKIEMDRATDEFSKSLSDAYTDLAEPQDARDKVSSVKEIEEKKKALTVLNSETHQKTAILYLFTAFDELHLLLIGPDNRVKHFGSSIETDKFNNRIMQFYALLQAPAYDPRILGKELYELIFRPVEAELKRENIQTLMWSLDGSLRYIPIGALYDGEKYAAEKYRNVVVTRTDKERMINTVSRTWTGSAFGSSKAQAVDLLGNGNKVVFPELPGVTTELRSIFEKDPSGNLILPGDVLIDGRFTKSAFFDELEKHRPLVHISSHFAFRPGDDTQSFLVLGEGFLTLNEMKKRTDLFRGVELLTLSACNTAATQPDADGREIDGFAELAQRLGADAVLATLWQVSDASTPLLMRDFYTTRQSGTGVTKAEAIQEAQLGLLHGTSRPGPMDGNVKGPSLSGVKMVITRDGRPVRNGRGVEIVYIAAKDAPFFNKDETKPFSHPYYWAPFVLYGNWR